jgi:hypothetical protein
VAGSPTRRAHALISTISLNVENKSTRHGRCFFDLGIAKNLRGFGSGLTIRQIKPLRFVLAQLLANPGFCDATPFDQFRFAKEVTGFQLLKTSEVFEAD